MPRINGDIAQIHTVNLMHPVNLVHKLATSALYNIEVKLPPLGRYSNLWTRKISQGMQSQTVQNKAKAVEQNDR